MVKSIEEILNGLDRLFEEQKMAEVEPYLQKELQEAMDREDFSVVITIVNELIGFYRDISQYEKALFYCEQILPFMEIKGLKNTIHYATTCLNVANAYRAAGEWAVSLKYYEEVKKVYDRMLTPTDSLYASYFNNLSLLYQEMGEFEKASECLKTALVIMEAYGDEIKVAITCSNLAASLLRCGDEQQAEKYLNRALQIFKNDGERDFHYGAALSVMGELQFKKNRYEDSLYYYKKALEELEKHVGKTEYYYRTLDNVEQVEKVLAKRKNREKSFEKDRDVYSIDSAAEKNIKLTKLEKSKDLYGENWGNGEESTKERYLGRVMFEDFYYEYGLPMLEKKFPAFLDKIAIGKVGEGSECFGFEDEVSLDHDFGPGFCMWVTRETYEQIGIFLQAEYEKLPKTFRGVTRKEMENGKERVGVCIIEDFYKRIIGIGKAPETLQEWSRIEEFALATATNGWVLKDKEGIFTGIRDNLLSYYPDEIWRAKTAQCMYTISQYGQYNYERMAKRNDIVTMEQCRSRFVTSVMELVYLLNRTYAPYYKWMMKGMERLEDFGISNMLKRLVVIPIMNVKDNTVLMEHICIVLLESMEKKGLLKKNPRTTYLEHYIPEIFNNIVSSKCEKEESKEMKDSLENTNSIAIFDDKSQDDMREKSVDKENMLETEKAEQKEMKDSKKILVERLVALEWQNFDQVKNEGGRAECQDDWGTFSIMRTSQYLTWTEDMLRSYIRDFESAMEKGWNLITEKYGRMMESTAPQKYEEIKDSFPILPEEKKKIIEEIVKIQVAWMEEFALNYPYMAENSRVIYTSEDTVFSTSFETYLRGEMKTYSDRTLDLYGRFIVSYLQEGKNLTKDIMTNTALLYGYESLEKAEELLKK